MTGFVRLPLLSIAALATAATPKLASAHPGHAFEVVSSDSPLHYFLQWEHLAILIATAAVLAFGTRSLVALVQSRRTTLQPIPVRKDGQAARRTRDDRLQ